MSRRLKSSIKKIEDTFGQIQKKNITINEKKNGLSDSTIKTYKEQIITLMNYSFEKHGIADVRKIEEKHIQEYLNEKKEQYKNGDLSKSFSMKKFLAAVKLFQKGTRETNVFNKRELLKIDTDEVRKELREEKVIRYSQSSKVLKSTEEQCLSVIERIKNEGRETNIREISWKSSYLSLKTGGRITSILSLKRKDIDFNNNTISFIDDKGGLDRTVEISKETTDFLRELCEGKKDNQLLFTSKRKDGTFKSIQETRKEVSKVIKNHSDHLKTVEKVKLQGKDSNGDTIYKEVEKRFTFHSFRKSFAQVRTEEYYKKFDTKENLDKYISQRVSENPKLKGKINSLREKINEKRNEKRDLTRKEWSIFFCSVDLGHFRNNVITEFYISTEKIGKK